MAAVPSRTRAECVTKLSVLLDTVLRTEQDLVVVTYDYLPAYPGGVSPIVAVTASGVQPRGNVAKRRMMEYYINVYWYVLFSSKSANIDDEQSWAILNNIEQVAVETLMVNSHVEGYWNSIEFVDPSDVRVVPFDNHGYLVEGVPLRVHTF